MSKPYFHDQVGLQLDKERQQEIAHFNKQTNSEESSKKRTRFPKDDNSVLWLYVAGISGKREGLEAPA